MDLFTQDVIDQNTAFIMLRFYIDVKIADIEFFKLLGRLGIEQEFLCGFGFSPFCWLLVVKLDFAIEK